MSNLPPGVTDNMIPGNRPEDMEYDRFSDALWDVLASFGIDVANLSDAEQNEVDVATDILWALVQGARPEVG